MVQAAVNPETGEFLGLIIPKADLAGPNIIIYGTAENWARAMAGEFIDPAKIGVYIGGGHPAEVSCAPIPVEGLKGD